MNCPMCDDTGYKDDAGFRMEPCDHKVTTVRRPSLFLEPATDWTGQSVEERLEECASALYLYGLMRSSDHQRTRNRIRAIADFQREEHAKHKEDWR